MTGDMWITGTGNITSNDSATWLWDSSTSDKVNVLVPAQVSTQKQKDPEPEGALEWLDRRVDEMRVEV